MEHPLTQVGLQQQIPAQPPPSEQQVSFLDLFRYADFSDWVLIAVGCVCSCASGASFPVFAFISGNMIDSFDGSVDLVPSAVSNLYLYLGLGVVSMLVGMVMFSAWTIIGERQAIKLRQQYFKSLLKQEMGWFDMKDPSSTSTAFQIDSMNFQLAVGQKISAVLVILSMLVVGVGVALFIGWILTLIVLSYIPILVIIWSKSMQAKVQTDTEEDKIYQDSDAKAQQTFSAIKLVKQMNGEDFQCSIQQSFLQRVQETYSSTIKKYTACSAIAVLALGLIFPLTFWYGSECVFNTKLCPQSISTSVYTAGSVVKILYCLLLPAIGLNQLAPCLQKIADGKAAAKRIFSLIERQPQVSSKSNALIPQSFKGHLQFVDVSFAYPKDKKKRVLNKLNFKIDSSHSALVGSSGCGKSTLFQLIMRFYDPDEGAIYLDGIDLRDLNLEWLRSQIGFVTQEPFLFALSLRQNLLLGKPDATEEQIKQALKKAEAYDFVEELPQKLETFAGSGGSQLSGGQKQRIAIARALLKGSKLILMDEATSALDRINERKILQTLKNLQSNFRSISITHRKKVLRSVEKVYRIQKGKVIQVDMSNSQSIIRSCRGLQKIQSSFREDNELSSFLDQDDPKQLQQEQREPQKEQIMEVSSQQIVEDNKGGLSRLAPYLYQEKGYLIAGAVCNILNGFTFPAYGIIMAKTIIQFLIYQNSTNYDIGSTQKLYLAALVLAFIDTAINTLSKVLFSIMSKNIVNKIRRQCFRKLIRMPISWFQKKQHSSEKITTEMTVNCKELYSFMKMFMAHIFALVVSVLFSFVGSVVFEWRTGLTSIALIPLIVLAQAIQMSFISGLTQSKSKIYKQSVQTIKESVLNIRTVLSLSAQRVMYNRYEQQLSVMIDTIKSKALLSGVMFGVGTFFQFFTCAMICFLAAIYIDRFSLGIEGPLQAIFLIFFASIMAGNNSSYLSDISSAKLAAQSIFTTIDLKDQFEILEQSGSKRLTTPIKGNIRFDNVSFKYPSREEEALKQINLEVAEGESIGIVGSSGCGKSTLFSLLLGFYAPTQGRILVEGVDIKDYDLRHLRGSFGMVSQEPVLFNESIAWNIRYNMYNASDSQVIQASKAANYNPSCRQTLKETRLSLLRHDRNLQEETSFQPFKRKVGPKGSHVSGGQKQRIAIARTILRSPSVLLLDEATSALDPQNEAAVQTSLERLMKGRTTLNITHRLEQVEKVDRVVVVSQGRVEEEGPFSSLGMDRDGSFWKMLRGSELKPAV